MLKLLSCTIRVFKYSYYASNNVYDSWFLYQVPYHSEVADALLATEERKIVESSQNDYYLRSDVRVECGRQALDFLELADQMLS